MFHNMCTRFFPTSFGFPLCLERVSVIRVGLNIIRRHIFCKTCISVDECHFYYFILCVRPFSYYIIKSTINTSKYVGFSCLKTVSIHDCVFRNLMVSSFVVTNLVHCLLVIYFIFWLTCIVFWHIITFTYCLGRYLYIYNIHTYTYI